jgi:hypothetical protein
MLRAAHAIQRVYALTDRHDILVCQITGLRQVAEDLWLATTQLEYPKLQDAKAFHERCLQQIYLSSPSSLAPAQTGIFACPQAARTEAALRMGSEIAQTMEHLASLKEKQHALLAAPDFLRQDLPH